MILDHLTVLSARPLDLVAAASEAGFDGVGLFLRGMHEVAGMPDFDLTADVVSRRDCRRAAADAGCRIAVAYPFTVTGASRPDDFLPALDAAAEIRTESINILAYDSETARCGEAIASLCAAAAARGLSAAIEFFPISAIRSLDDAIRLCEAVDKGLKVNVDLLHLARSGSDIAQVRTHRDLISLVQLCDAPHAAPADLFAEASHQRLLPGDGELDCLALIEACGDDVQMSIEAPTADAVDLHPVVVAKRAYAAADRLFRCDLPLSSPIARSMS
ncbi:TIM barrel protein [uncultured Sphingomonas sp.]|uniref:sugar phosphate isomerase/epimerase family protein n=1 Tax=uncultured Sphingomonas sp. TaxID=158754 RepID=UPI00260D2FCD|nr:TIM barrel protein [uncultured Sphingomonas sp.]